jgi:hypothetical protein
VALQGNQNRLKHNVSFVAHILCAVPPLKGISNREIPN